MEIGLRWLGYDIGKLFNLLLHYRRYFSQPLTALADDTEIPTKPIVGDDNVRQQLQSATESIITLHPKAKQLAFTLVQIEVP